MVFLVGPTAVGKTDLSIQLARRLDAEILSADSRLFYRGMDIGTAKPSPAERRTIPHHLVDFLDPDESFSLAEFQAAVYQIAGDVLGRGRLPLVVGGTGQYVRAITEGWQIPALAPHPELRMILERIAADRGAGALHSWLETLDPPSAQAIDPRNLRRTVRALEVIFSSGRPFSAQRRKGKRRFDAIVLGLIRPRDELYERIDRRVDEMLANGLVNEVQSLLDAGYPPGLPSMSAIGYREIAEVLTGSSSLPEDAAAMKKRSRTLVRRQANWFKPDDPGITWFQAGEGALARIESHLRSRLL